nr:MAG TPA: Tail fiber protein [Caudoviricetes sp.]
MEISDDLQSYVYATQFLRGNKRKSLKKMNELSLFDEKTYIEVLNIIVSGKLDGISTFQEMVSSSDAMSVIVESDFAMEIITSSPTVMSVISKSDVAMEKIMANSTALEIIMENEAAMAAVENLDEFKAASEEVVLDIMCSESGIDRRTVTSLNELFSSADSIIAITKSDVAWRAMYTFNCALESADNFNEAKLLSVLYLLGIFTSESWSATDNTDVTCKNIANSTEAVRAVSISTATLDVLLNYDFSNLIKSKAAVSELVKSPIFIKWCTGLAASKKIFSSATLCTALASNKEFMNALVADVSLIDSLRGSSDTVKLFADSNVASDIIVENEFALWRILPAVYSKLFSSRVFSKRIIQDEKNFDKILDQYSGYAASNKEFMDEAVANPNYLKKIVEFNKNSNLKTSTTAYAIMDNGTVFDSVLSDANMSKWFFDFSNGDVEKYLDSNVTLVQKLFEHDESYSAMLNSTMRNSYSLGNNTASVSGQGNIYIESYVLAACRIGGIYPKSYRSGIDLLNDSDSLRKVLSTKNGARCVVFSGAIMNYCIKYSGYYDKQTVLFDSDYAWEAILGDPERNVDFSNNNYASQLSYIASRMLGFSSEYNYDYLLGSSGYYNKFADNPKALRPIILSSYLAGLLGESSNYSACCNTLRDNPSTLAVLLSKKEFANKILSYTSFSDGVLGSEKLFTVLAKSELGMSYVVTNSSIMNKIAASAHISAIAFNEQIASDMIFNNPSALSTYKDISDATMAELLCLIADIDYKTHPTLSSLNSDESAANILIKNNKTLRLINVNTFAAEVFENRIAAINLQIVLDETGLSKETYKTFDAVAASSTAMNAVAASSTAMNAVVASSTAMNAVAASSTAMNAVAASSTAMNAVAKNATTTSMKSFLTFLNNSQSLVTTAYNTLQDVISFKKGTVTHEDGVTKLNSSCTVANSFIACYLGSYSPGFSSQLTNLFYDGTQIASHWSKTKPRSVDASTCNAIGFTNCTFTETDDGQAAIVVYTAI